MQKNGIHGNNSAAAVLSINGSFAAPLQNIDTFLSSQEEYCHLHWSPFSIELKTLPILETRESWEFIGVFLE